MALILSGSSATNKPELVPLTEKLDDDNFITWKHLAWLTIQILGMEHHLDASKTPKAPQESAAYKEWRQNDLALTTWLRASMSTTFKNKVVHCTNFSDAWFTIINYFSITLKTRIWRLKSQLKSIKKTGSIADYLARIRKLADSLLAVGYQLQDEDHIQVILDGLTVEYSNYITVVMSRMETFSVSEAEAFLLQYEDMLDRFKNQAKDGGARRGHRGRFQRGGRSSWNNSRTLCQICGENGHVALNCFYRFDQQYQPGLGSSSASPQISWYPDSGASHHVTTDPNNFLSSSQGTHDPDHLLIMFLENSFSRAPLGEEFMLLIS
ncbi:hypothetical protein AHAS_Ahas12G0209300 [Arachis hypogaea]